jgi:cell division protein FtsI (penicillin-binding protein 3)
MIKSNDRIILEDYENEFSYKKNKSNLNIQFNRIAFIFFVFFIISLIYSIQLLHLGSRKAKVEDKIQIVNKKNHRADIIDQNGDYLVKTVSSIDVGINPSEVIDKKKLLINLRLIFPEKNYEKIRRNLDKDKFFYFEKKISEENYEKIMLLGDKSIKSEEKLTRLYPQKNLFSHIIGQIDDDNNGISGLEKSLDERLKNDQNPVELTVDSDIQFLIRAELIKFQKIFRSKGSAAILMNVNSGAIISMVSLPDFDLNKRKNIVDTNYINKVTKGTYELGSVFKTFTIAAGLNEEIIKPDTKFENLPKTIKPVECEGKPISEYNMEIPSDLTAEEILIRSGNIGTVRIAQELGIERYKSFLTKIGILKPIDFDIEEVAHQSEIKWRRCKLLTAAFGHGVATTLLQLAKAYAIISNGGYDIKPSLIKTDNKILKKKNKILKDGISNEINPILRKIVSTKEGTAEQADVNGYEVGGKTGTAQQPVGGTYSNIKINTFSSIFPMTNPKYVFVVMLEAPKTSESYVYNYRNQKGSIIGTPYNTAGWTSVEVVGKIIERIGPILATKYIES